MPRSFTSKLIPAQLDRVRPCELPVIGDLAETIPAFQAELQRHSLPDFSRWRAVACGAERAELDPRGLAQPTIRFLDELFSRLPEDSVVLADVGQHQMWAAQRYRSSSPRGFITSGGLGAMGFALPAAVGVQLAKPDACVLCVSGDGGFQMNIQELATVHRLGLPVKMVIIDNKYLGMVRQWQQLFYQRNYAETDLSDNPDFVEIAKAYKIHSFRLNEDAMREFPVSQETGDADRPIPAVAGAGVAGVRLRSGGQRFSDGSGRRGAFGDVAGRRTDAVVAAMAGTFSAGQPARRRRHREQNICRPFTFAIATRREP